MINIDQPLVISDEGLFVANYYHIHMGRASPAVFATKVTQGKRYPWITMG